MNGPSIHQISSISSSFPILVSVHYVEETAPNFLAAGALALLFQVGCRHPFNLLIIILITFFIIFNGLSIPASYPRV